MADIKVRIEVNPNAETEFLGDIQNKVGTSGSVENLSNVSIKTDSLGVFQSIPTMNNAINGRNGLSLAQEYLVFNADGYLCNPNETTAGVLGDEQNPDEFVWGVVPENGEYRVKLTFSNAQNLKDIVVKGDTVVGQFPTQAIVDGETTIYSDDNNWAINLQTESTTHTIEFTHWNRANYNACLTLISVMLRYFEVDKYNGLKSVESLTQSTGQPKEIFYGLVPSSGQIEIIDVNGEIADMVNDGVMPNSNVKIDIVANSKQVNSHISESSSYVPSVGEQSLTIEVGNTLSIWENVSFSGYQLNSSSSLYQILKEVLSTIYSESEIDEMLTDFTYNDDGKIVTILEYLQSIIIEFPYINVCSLKEAIDKICVLAQLNVFENRDGKIKFISSRPILTKGNFINIPTKSQLSILSQDLFINNKYSSVNVQYSSPMLTDNSLQNVKYTYYTYDEISTDPNAYTKVINSANKNPNLTVIYEQIDTQANKETPPNPLEDATWNNWYYYIAKFNISYDLSDLTILRNFNPKIAYSVFMIFPNQSNQTRTSDVDYSTITPYSYEYTDDQIISDWIQYNEDKQRYEIKSGVGNWEFKVRKNQDGTLTLFYVSLFKILNYVYIGLTQIRGITVVSLYNELNIDFICPKLSNTSMLDRETNSDVTISNNELLQDNVSVGDKSLVDFIPTNILSDYKDGIHYAEISVICGDYFDINGKKVKSWENGELFNIGDNVIVERNSLKYRITGVNFNKTSVPKQDLQLQEIKYNSVSFTQDDWDLINQISQSGTAHLYYNVGDEKIITLTSGEQITLQILDFNHDIGINNNPLGLTLGMKNVLNTKYAMNSTDTNVGGWAQSQMRTSTMQALYDLLPSDLKVVVKQAKKSTSAGNGSSEIVVSNDYLWLLSQVEISGNLVGTYTGEGYQYRYWEQHNTETDRVKLTSNGQKSSYWLRSPKTYNEYMFKIISGSGQVDDLLALEASNTDGVSFCLCV